MIQYLLKPYNYFTRYNGKRMIVDFSKETTNKITSYFFKIIILHKVGYMIFERKYEDNKREGLEAIYYKALSDSFEFYKDQKERLLK